MPIKTTMNFYKNISHLNKLNCFAFSKQNLHMKNGGIYAALIRSDHVVYPIVV